MYAGTRRPLRAVLRHRRKKRQVPDMTTREGSRRLARDQDGGIEGLPLQLLIMVVVAGLGLTIIMGWMNSIETPHTVGEVYVTPGEVYVYDPEGDGMYTNDGIVISVVVTDQGGDRLEGATVLLDGANVRNTDGTSVRGVTDSLGQVVFDGITVEQFGSGLGTITVTVAKGDYGIDSSYEIPIIPS